MGGEGRHNGGEETATMQEAPAIKGPHSLLLGVHRRRR